MADLLAERWPVLAGQLDAALRSEGEVALADEVAMLEVVAMCSCSDDFCQSFYTAAPPDGAYGPGRRNVLMDAPWPGFLILDVVDGRIMFVEVIDRPRLD